MVFDDRPLLLCSNASLNLPDGFSILPQLYEDDEEDGSEDGDKKLETESLSAINTARSTEAEEASEKFRTVLEDVDGELEMEDVSPTADSELLANKEREQIFADHFAEEARSNPTQPPLPLDPPPSVPSPPPLPADPPPSPPPPPRSPPPPLTTSQSPYPQAHSLDTGNHQQSDSPSTPAAYPGQGNLGLSQVSHLALCLHMFSLHKQTLFDSSWLASLLRLHLMRTHLLVSNCREALGRIHTRPVQ